MSAKLNADLFLKRLKALRSPTVAKLHNHLASDNDAILGVRMGQVFALAKEFMNMSLDETESMLESPIHEMRVGAVSIMDFQARSKKTTDARKKELFDLYIKHHDRINTWDLVDRSAVHVVGSYLFDKSRKILYKLARSKNMPERRTAIVSTLYFIGKGDVEDSFKLAEMLLYDKEDLIHKANGWALRFAGDKDRQGLIQFLDQHAATMPRVTLRYATEHFAKKQREHYLSMKKGDDRMNNKKGFTSIDEYIAACPVETHERLQEIRAAIRRIAPKAKEKISYQMAAFELNGKNLIAFAGWKKHVSIYPIPSGSAVFNKEVSQYADGKGTVKFPLDKPFPLELISQIIKYRLTDHLKNTVKKPSKRK